MASRQGSYRGMHGFEYSIDCLVPPFSSSFLRIFFASWKTMVRIFPFRNQNRRLTAARFAFSCENVRSLVPDRPNWGKKSMDAPVASRVALKSCVGSGRNIARQPRWTCSSLETLSILYCTGGRLVAFRSSMEWEDWLFRRIRRVRW